MTNVVNNHDFRASVYLVDHSVISHTNAILTFRTVKFTVLRWKRVLS